MRMSGKWKTGLYFLLILGGLSAPLYMQGQLSLLENGAAVRTAKEQKTVPVSKVTQANETPGLSPEEILSRLDRDAHRTGSWFEHERDDLLTSLIGSIVSIVVGFLLILGLRRFAQSKIRKKNELWRWEVLHVLTTPAILLLVLTSCFLFFFPVLKSLPRNLHEMDMRFFYATVTLIVAWGIFGLVSVMGQKIRKFAERSDNTLDNLTVSMIGNTIKIAIAVTAILFIGQNIFHLDITALLAGAGVIGLAIALAAKDTVSNFFGTIVIIADSPFRLGDRIKTGDINGIVTHVGMRSSKITTADESVYTIPNSLLTNTTVCNVNNKGRIKHVMDVGLTYDTTPEQMEQAMRILHEITDNFHGPDAAGFAPHIFFSQFANSSMNIHMILWFKTNSFIEEEALLNELNMSILKRFNDAGLNMAYPTQTIYLEEASGTRKEKT